MQLQLAFVILMLALACSYADERDKQATTLKREQDVQPEGYSYSYETSNGISANERGALQNDAIAVQGNAQWTDPEGTPVQISYVADENGYQPTGSHVPQVPEYVLRAIEYIRTHPPPPAK